MLSEILGQPDVRARLCDALEEEHVAGAMRRRGPRMLIRASNGNASVYDRCLAREVAVGYDLHPHRPRGLNKVTPTR